MLACQTLSKALDISRVTTRVAQDLLKALAILSDIRYCNKIQGWPRRPKTIPKIRKKAIFLQVINSSIIYKFFKDFTNHRKKTNRAVVFSCRHFPMILKYRNHRRNLPSIWKARLLQTLIEEFSQNERKFRLAILQNHHRNTTRCL